MNTFWTLISNNMHSRIFVSSQQIFCDIFFSKPRPGGWGGGWIYVLPVSSEDLNFEIFKLLCSKEKFNLDWVIQYFRENEEFLASVVRGLGIMFDREEFLFIINELREVLNG